MRFRQYGHTYCYFTQVNPVIQRVPGTLFVVGFPGLLKDLVHTLAFLAFEPVAARDAWSPWDTVISRVTFSPRGAGWALQTAAILENQGGEEARVKGSE